MINSNLQKILSQPCYLNLSLQKFRQTNRIKYQEDLKKMITQVSHFYVRVKSDLEKAFRDFFPHMSSNYIKMSKLFNKDKKYPVLAVEKVTVFTKDGDEVESARFLVPSENNNFIWIQSELFEFEGFVDDCGE